MKAIIQITTFIGTCADARHYYGKMQILPEGCTIELQRQITQAEIEDDKDRFYSYKTKDITSSFLSWKDVINEGKAKAEKLGISEIKVVGIPNNAEVSIEYALSDKIDTRLKCCRCGKVIKGGCYNYPSGVVCIECGNKQKRWR